MADGKVRPFRYTKGRLSVELTFLVIFFTLLWRFVTWGFRRCKPIAYHPIGVVGLTIVVCSYLLSPWLTALLFWAVLVWQRGWPDSYQRHAHHRVQSFWAGFYYRWRLRKKLTGSKLLHSEEPLPTISDVRKIGCTTKVRIKQSYGDTLVFWRVHLSAQTWNAHDCKINPYYRPDFTTFRLDGFVKRPPFVLFHFDEPKVLKPRWLELEFLTRDPFTKVIGPEYIEFYRDLYANIPEMGNPVGPYRNGQPHCYQVRTHKLVVAPSQRGKSNALRAMIFADHWAVQAGLVENWGCDLKRGVEINFMREQFAHTEFGLDGPEMVARFFEDAERVMNKRLDRIRDAGEGVRHVIVAADPERGIRGEPALRIYIDEFLAFEDTEYNGDYRNRIYRAISAIQRRGAAAGVSIIAFSQDPKKDKFPLRDGFLEVEVGGGLTQTQVGMVMPGGWDDGARTDLVDLPGVFYVRNETLLAPEQFRYALITNGTIKGLKPCPDSVLWPPSEEEERQQVHDEVFIA